MIKVLCKDNYIKISGHAGYAEAGKDIVCASVSSVIYTTVNGILNIDNNAIKFEDNNDVMKITIINETEITGKLIDNMFDIMQELERQYPDKIKISKGE